MLHWLKSPWGWLPLTLYGSQAKLQCWWRDWEPMLECAGFGPAVWGTGSRHGGHWDGRPEVRPCAFRETTTIENYMLISVWVIIAIKDNILTAPAGRGVPNALWKLQATLYAACFYLMISHAETCSCVSEQHLVRCFFTQARDEQMRRG